jgi:hypothetical protein
MVSTKWREDQSRYLSSIGSAKASRRWVESLIRKLWEVAWDLWEHRNGILHHKEASIIISQLNAEISTEFREKESLLAPDKALFRVGLNSLLSKPIEIKQQWLARIKLARQRRTQADALGAEQSQERRVMARWLNKA